MKDKLLNDIAPVSTTDEAEEKTVDAGTEIAPGAEAAPESDPVTLGGTAVSPGAAFGHAQMFAEGELEIPHFTIEKTQTRAEFTRLRAAVHTVDKEFGELIAELNREEDAPTEAIAFLELHRQLLNDDSIISETQDIIRERLINAEWALSLKLEDIRRSFEEIDDDYLADRIDDIAQVIERVQRVLSGRRRPADTVSRMMSESSVILVAEDFSPADILILKRRQDISITGLIIEKGAATSHSSILARSLEIPTLVNVSNACEVIQTDDVLLMDADKGIVIVNPQKDGMPQMSERIRKMNAVRLRQRKLKATHCVTADGCAVSLLANLALPEDAKEAMSNGADGVGLFRSEFLFMNRPNFPSEDEPVRNLYTRRQSHARQDRHDPHHGPRRRQTAFARSARVDRRRSGQTHRQSVTRPTRHPIQLEPHRRVPHAIARDSARRRDRPRPPVGPHALLDDRSRHRSQLRAPRSGRTQGSRSQIR